MLKLVGSKTLKADETYTLTDLFDKASEIGGVRIWQHRRGTQYQVKIVFHRRSGGEIEACGTDTDLSAALIAAIKEALLLQD